MTSEYIETHPEYDVIGHEELSDLIRLVNEKLADGWKLQGGINTYIVSRDTWVKRVHLQAIVRPNGYWT